MLTAVRVAVGAGRYALGGVTLAFPVGQIVMVVGASGAGKSTLLGVLAGLVTPETGHVAAPTRRDVAFVQQDLGLVPRAHVAANIVMGMLADTPLWRVLIGRYRRADRARALALAKAVALRPDQWAQPVGALSGGEQQRVAIARACMRPAKLLLADEPVANLDPATARMVMEVLTGHARATGATLVCVLHQLDLARSFADRLIVLDAGQVAFDGPPDGWPIRETVGEPGPSLRVAA